MAKITSRYYRGWIHVNVNTNSVTLAFEYTNNKQNKMITSHVLSFKEIARTALSKARGMKGGE